MSACRILILGFILVGFGCEKTDGTGAKQEKSPAAAPAGGKASADVCTTYADKLCEIVDPASPMCGSVKTATGLMPVAACQAGMTDLAYSQQKYKEKGKACTELADKLCNDLGNESKTCEMVRAQTPKFPPDRCVSMMEKYSEILADLKRREESNKPLTAEKQELVSKGDGPTFGPADAKVTLVEFSDFQCPFCSRAATAVGEIKKQYPKEIRIVFRQFPLSFHKNAHLAAQAAMAAHAQGKFWEFHDKLFANQQALERANLETYAKELNLDVNKFKQDLDSEKFKAAVDADMELGNQVAVSGTPTLFLNGERVQNAIDAKAISQQIDKALGRAPAPAPAPAEGAAEGKPAAANPS